LEVVPITHLKNFAYGIVLGTVNIIPGISGGTVAVLLNIYEKILNSVSLVNIRGNLAFLIPLGFGAVCGVFSFSKIMTFLLSNYSMVMYYIFMGMIVGCIPIIYKRAKYDKLKSRNIAVFAVSFAFMLYLAYIDDGSLTNKTLAQLGGIDPPLLAWLFFAGFVSAIAMVLPGISGSLILLALGAYTVSLEAVSTLNLTIIFTVGAGVLFGALAGIKLIKKMLRSHPQALYCSILGLVAGSIFTIYPGFSPNSEGVLCIALALLTAALTFFFSKGVKTSTYTIPH
jgi:putative membrane protein